jgi:hypothetical protein
LGVAIGRNQDFRVAKWHNARIRQIKRKGVMAQRIRLEKASTKSNPEKLNMALMKCNVCSIQFYGEVCPSCGKKGLDLPDTKGIVAEIGLLLSGMTAREHTTQKWREASQDLGFDFLAPFTLPDGEDTLAYVGLVAEFGSTRGTLIIDDSEKESMSRLMRIASERGYGCSCMSMSYGAYDRKVFIELLNEWGWCGSPDRTPSWYTEWSEQNEDDI